MNQRERFNATAKFQQVDRTFLIPTWTWDSTLERWYTEGLPHGTDLAHYFGTDSELG